MVTSGTKARRAAGPYKGLRPYRAEDHHAFFGRGEESREIRELWETRPLTILHGASGAGRTSLLQAGVRPLLSPNRTDVLPVGRVTYGSAYPQAALPDHDPYVLALLMSWSPLAPPTRLAGLTIPAFLRSRPVKRDVYGERTLTMVSIDQVEELFTGGERHQPYRDWFFGQLAEALDADPGLRVLLSVRADHLASLEPYERALAGSGAARYPLEPLGFDAALEAVAKPMADTGRALSEGAAAHLVDDLVRVRARTDTARQREGVEPVQLQVVCQALWKALPPDSRTITVRDVLQHGDADTALARHYDRLVDDLAAERFDGDEHGLRTWLRLTFGASRGGRRPVGQSSTGVTGIGEPAFELLVQRHLLRAGRHKGEGWYELAYDRLLDPAPQDDRPAQAPPREPSPPEDCLRAAEGALRQGDLTLAARRGEEALARSQEDELELRAEIESLLGNVDHRRGNLAAAVSRYSRAAKGFETAGVATAVGPLLTAIGRLRLAQGSPEEAVRDLRAAMIRLPADLAVQTELAWALWHGGHPEAALGVLDGVLDREGNNLDALLGRGQILAGLGRGRDALRDLDRARPLRWPFARVAHALALAQVDSLAEAEREMAEALAEVADHGPLLLYAAKVKELAGQTTSAADLARRAISASAPPLPGHMEKDARRLVAV
ncbi:tetratricopeptide repeat protein [Nonomuraea sp. SBT364]|uniref:tetratricopeptide repeat protein n=1 Tax=Nonomuraea sp. SBT364 TaxID=1580530 RepID=UPI00066C6CD4|nr:hypothetical protein [Nonomuraea sp. SBT364]